MQIKEESFKIVLSIFNNASEGKMDEYIQKGVVRLISGVISNQENTQSLILIVLNILKIIVLFYSEKSKFKYKEVMY